MSTPAILNFDELLAPVSGDVAVGSDLRADSSPRSTYYAVRDARNQARTAERQAQMNGESPSGAGDWSTVVTSVPQILAAGSKDLEFATYLVEGLARTHGFAGIRDGFHLIRELVTRYGDDIYPLPDEDGLETRLAPLTGLNGADGEGTLIGPIRNISLTERQIGEYSTASYEQAVDLERASPETKEHRLANGAVDLTTIQNAIAQSSNEFLLQLRDDLQECIEEYGKYTKAVDDKYGRDAPPTSNIQSALDHALDVLKALAGARLQGSEATPATETGAAAAPSATGQPAAARNVSGPIQNREEAFRQLQQIAQFFKQTEPHTPITYAIEQVVRWGKMPLPELLRELIPDPSSVQQMFRLVGIPQDENR